MKPSYDGTVFVVLVDTPLGSQPPLVFVDPNDAYAEFRRQADYIAVVDYDRKLIESDIEVYREDHQYWTDGVSSVRLYATLLIRKDA